MTDAAYSEAVKEVFVHKPLRSVLMVDDQFPTYDDITSGRDVADKFREGALARSLYVGFRERHMVCDIENDVSEVKVDIVRKSDLVVLDYHLAHENTEKSIDLLCRLAASKHFNAVVLYTAADKLDDVWLDVLSALVGKLEDKEIAFQEEEQALWDKFTEEAGVPQPPEELVHDFARRRQISDLDESDGQEFAKYLAELREAGFGRKFREVATKMIVRKFNSHVGKFAELKKATTVGACDSSDRWIQSGNLFVAILGKKAPSTAQAAKTDPAAEVMSCLENALLSWNPSFVQILISEIQNVFELDGLATESSYLREPETQAALWYYLLTSLGSFDNANTPLSKLRAPVVALVDKILEGIRHRLSNDNDLLDLCSKALAGQLRDTAWNPWPAPHSTELANKAISIAKLPRSVDITNLFFRLNSFLTTERHRLEHVTTGTVFCLEADGEKAKYFVVASPACDLAGRPSRKGQTWAHQLSPEKAIIVLHLEKLDTNSHAKALNCATDGQYIFLEIGTDKHAFKVVDSVLHPIYEFMFVEDEGRVRSDSGKPIFEAWRVERRVEQTRVVEAGDAVAAEEEASTRVESVKTNVFARSRFAVAGQLRDLNAMRVLQLAGQHLSRIGMDFIGQPKT